MTFWQMFFLIGVSPLAGLLAGYLFWVVGARLQEGNSKIIEVLYSTYQIQNEVQVALRQKELELYKKELDIVIAKEQILGLRAVVENCLSTIHAQTATITRLQQEYNHNAFSSSDKELN